MKISQILSLVVTASLGVTAGVACDVEDQDVMERGKHEEKACTLTQGYWKTHNRHAKQPKKAVDWPDNDYFDEDTTFMDNDLGFPGCPEHGTYLEVLHTPPAGSAYYILAHQYIAAKLNLFNGAGDPDAWQAVTDAWVILRDCEVSSDEFSEAIALSETLDDYNNGYWGPGHCDD